jgi:hypothetical protein
MFVDVNAIGSHFLPVLIFTRVYLKNDMLTGASTVPIGVTKTTVCSNYRLVVHYLKHYIACEMSGKEDPALLILYKYDPHLSIPAIVVEKENHISLITLPPHTSHKVRSLDNTVFGPYGTHDNTCLNDWILSNPGKSAKICSVAFTIGKPFGKAFVKHNV